MLHLCRDVVEECHVHSYERREVFVDADGGDVEHGGGYGRSSLYVVYKSEITLAGMKGCEGVVTSDGIGTFVRMVEVETFEHLFHTWQFGQSGVRKTPVGQQPSQGGEDVHASTGCCVGIEEGGNHDVGRIRRDAAVFGIESLASVDSPLRVFRAVEAAFEAVAIDGKETEEMLEGGTSVAVVGRSDAFEGCSEGNGRHIEGSCLGDGHSLEHILDGACLCNRA